MNKYNPNRHMAMTNYKNELMKHHTIVKRHNRNRAMKKNTRKVKI